MPTASRALPFWRRALRTWEAGSSHICRTGEEGHGLSYQAVHALHERGASLIVTVDCGTSSPREVAEASSLGMDTIITDHHTPPPEIPAALAVVNPRLKRSTYPFTGLAGVGLAFKLVQALCQRLGRQWDERLLQLAALGTVTDVTPLVGENRYIVAAGLSSLSANPKPGLKELLRVGGHADSVVDTESVSFVLGPRINAPGRLEHAISSYNLLRASSQEEAAPLAQELERLEPGATGSHGQGSRPCRYADRPWPFLRASAASIERGVHARHSGAAGQQACGGAL